MGRTKALAVTNDREETRPEQGGEPHALSILVHAKIKSGRIDLEGAAEALGFTVIYLRSLLNGHRRWSGVPPSKLRKLADMLEIKPRLSVFAMAGVVEPEDWLTGPMSDVLRDQFEAMRRDAKISPLLPAREAWQNLTFETRRLVVMMYLEILQLRTVAAVDEQAAKTKENTENFYAEANKRAGDGPEELVI